MEEIHIKIGKKLNKIRKNKGLSLDKVSEMTGVSKSMLGQIERGESIPTVTTLWKIATGLHLSFSTFVEEEQASVTIVSLENVKPVFGEDSSYRVYSMFPFDPQKKFEMYTIELDPGVSHLSLPHQDGVEEYIVVAKGTLEIVLNQQLYTVSEGNAIRFSAETNHTYRNRTEQLVRANLIIYYPS